jgi:hypothetical protein
MDTLSASVSESFGSTSGGASVYTEASFTVPLEIGNIPITRVGKVKESTKGGDEETLVNFEV